MSNIKKIIGVVLALVMALSVATIAFAANGDAYSVTITSDKDTIAAGETATVTVKVTANYNVSAISIPVFFDNSQVTVSAGATTLANATIATEASPDVDKFFAGSGHTKDDYGVRALVYIAPYNADITSYTDATVMTFTVTANDDATGAVVLECIQATVKTSSNPSGALYVAKNSSGNATVDSLAEVIDDATITAATTTINFAAGEEIVNTLAIKDSAPSIPFIDYNNAASTDYTAILYGMDTLGWNDDITPEGELADYLTTELGDDYLVIEPVDGGETTGTVIMVLDADGETVLETYVFVYFGDIDGDGLVDSNDDFAASYYGLNFDGISTLEQLMAGDLDGDGFPTADDGFAMSYYGLNYSGLDSQQNIGAIAYEVAYELI